MKIRSTLVNLSLIPLSIIILVFTLEILSALFKQSESGSSTCEGCFQFSKENSLGLDKWHHSNHVQRAVRRCSDQRVCYDVVYTFDEYGRRIVTNEKSSDQHLIIFGDSIAMGEGLSDNQTLAYHLQQQAEARVYNYSISGGGAAHTLSIVESGRLPVEVPERSGTAIFVAADYQIYRGSLSSNRPWAFNSPFYLKTQDSKIIRKASQAGYYKKLSTLFASYNWLKEHSILLQVLDMNFVVGTQNSLAELMALTLLKTKKLYETDFKGKFIIVLHPQEKSSLLSATLQKHGLDYLSPGIKSNRSNILCHCDRHPSGRTNSRLAKLIIESF